MTSLLRKNYQSTEINPKIQIPQFYNKREYTQGKWEKKQTFFIGTYSNQTSFFVGKKG